MAIRNPSYRSCPYGPGFPFLARFVGNDVTARLQLTDENLRKKLHIPSIIENGRVSL